MFSATKKIVKFQGEIKNKFFFFIYKQNKNLKLSRKLILLK